MNSIEQKQAEIDLRDRFAMAVLTGMAYRLDSTSTTWTRIADLAYSAADAMLKERAK